MSRSRSGSSSTTRTLGRGVVVFMASLSSGGGRRLSRSLKAALERSQRIELLLRAPARSAAGPARSAAGPATWAASRRCSWMYAAIRNASPCSGAVGFFTSGSSSSRARTSSLPAIAGHRHRHREPHARRVAARLVESLPRRFLLAGELRGGQPAQALELGRAASRLRSRGADLRRWRRRGATSGGGATGGATATFAGGAGRGAAARASRLRTRLPASRRPRAVAAHAASASERRREDEPRDHRTASVGAAPARRCAHGAPRRAAAARGCARRARRRRLRRCRRASARTRARPKARCPVPFTSASAAWRPR